MFWILNRDDFRSPGIKRESRLVEELVKGRDDKTHGAKSITSSSKKRILARFYPQLKKLIALKIVSNSNVLQFESPISHHGCFQFI